MYMYILKEPTHESLHTRAYTRERVNASLRADTHESKHKLFLFIFNRCQRPFLILFFNAPCFLLFCFRLFYAYELVEDDVGEETAAQTSTAEQSGPL